MKADTSPSNKVTSRFADAKKLENKKKGTMKKSRLAEIFSKMKK